MKKATTSLIVLAIAAVAALGYIGYVQLRPEKAPGQDQAQRPEGNILDAQHWQSQYPDIYASYMRKTGDSPDGKFGGEQQIDLIEKYPDIKILYEGFGFSKEYFATSSHIYTLDNVRKIGRPKPGGACLVCKTADYEPLLEKYGEQFFTMDFATLADEARYPVTCFSCHKNEPGTTNITTPHLAKAMKELNIEEKPGTSSCMQCHVEYYISADKKEVVLPWANGFGIDDIEKYFDDLDFADWEHPRTKTRLIKIQHPEYEMYRDSKHYNLGVSCADCHMPTVKNQQGQDYKSHWTGSPYKTVAESCLKCHGANRDPEQYIAENQALQQQVEDKELKTSGLLVELVEELAKATEAGEMDEEVLNQVRSLHRQAQIRWDFIFAENSTGFHNFQKAHEYLDKAMELAQQGLDILRQNGQ